MFFDHCDAQVSGRHALKRKGSLVALRDAALFKTTYAWGLRRQEAAKLDVVDFARRWGCTRESRTARSAPAQSAARVCGRPARSAVSTAAATATTRDRRSPGAVGRTRRHAAYTARSAGGSLRSPTAGGCASAASERPLVAAPVFHASGFGQLLAGLPRGSADRDPCANPRLGSLP